VKTPAALAFAGALLAATTSARALGVRSAALAWDKTGMLRGTFSFRDAIDDKVRKRLSNGLKVDIVMRGYVYPVGGGEPVALTAHTCAVAYDLWQGVFLVVENGGKSKPVVNMNGVYRLCTDMVDLPITDRAPLKGKPSDHYLAVKIEVNPVSQQLVKEIQRWVTRPLGVSGSITAGDALFATFVGVFIKKQVESADRVVEFSTASFPP
jgi:hypothetical protein